MIHHMSSALRILNMLLAHLSKLIEAHRATTRITPSERLACHASQRFGGQSHRLSPVSEVEGRPPLPSMVHAGLHAIS